MHILFDIRGAKSSIRGWERTKWLDFRTELVHVFDVFGALGPSRLRISPQAIAISMPDEVNWEIAEAIGRATIIVHGIDRDELPDSNSGLPLDLNGKLELLSDKIIAVMEKYFPEKAIVCSIPSGPTFSKGASSLNFRMG